MPHQLTIPAVTEGENRLKRLIEKARQEERGRDRFTALGKRGTGERIRQPTDPLTGRAPGDSFGLQAQARAAEERGETLIQQREPISGFQATRNLALGGLQAVGEAIEPVEKFVGKPLAAFAAGIFRPESFIPVPDAPPGTTVGDIEVQEEARRFQEETGRRPRITDIPEIIQQAQPLPTGVAGAIELLPWLAIPGGVQTRSALLTAEARALARAATATGPQRLLLQASADLLRAGAEGAAPAALVEEGVAKAFGLGVRGVIAGAKLTGRGIEEGLGQLPRFRASLAEQRGAITLGGVPDDDIARLLEEIDQMIASLDEGVPGGGTLAVSIPSRAQQLSEEIGQLEQRIKGLSDVKPVRPKWATGLSNDQLVNIARQEGVDPLARDWGDAIDSVVIREARQGFFKSAAGTQTITELKASLPALRSELRALQEPGGISRPLPEAAAGSSQQATLGEGFETGRTLEMHLAGTAGERVPLIEREPLQAAQASREAVSRGQQALPETVAERVPGGPRAEPLEPRRVTPAGPSVEAGTGPPGGRLPSGRAVGGPGRGQEPPPRDPHAMLVSALEPEREPLIARLRSELPQQVYDRNFPLKELENVTGVPARKSAQVVPGAVAAGEDIVRRFYGPIVKPVEKDLKFLERFMVLARMSDILARNPGARLPGGIANNAERLRALETLQREIGPERFAAIESTADQLWRLNDEQVLSAYVAEGIIAPAQRAAMLASHPHYIPFMRADFTERLTQNFGAAAEASVSTTGIRQMGLEGSERAISNPLQRLLQEPIKARTIIFRNRAAKTIVEALQALEQQTGETLVRFIEPKRQLDIAERVTGERVARSLGGGPSQQLDTISFFDNGVKNTVEVPAVYARVAKGLEAEPDNVAMQVVRAFNSPLRYGATTFNPFFLPVNIIRDAMSAMFREKVFPFGPDYMAGLWSAIRKNDTFTQASQSGALLSGVVENMNPTRALKNPLGGIKVTNSFDAIALPFRLVEQANIVAERGVRIGTFRKLKAEGLNNLEAAVRTRDATVDFAKSGHAMRVINGIIPFTNAAVQGSSNIARTIRDHPGRSAAFGAMFASATIMSRVNNLRYETSELIPDYEYTRNYVIQFGEGTRSDNTKFPIYVKIPKGEIAAMFTFPAEALFNLSRQTETRTAVE